MKTYCLVLFISLLSLSGCNDNDEANPVVNLSGEYKVTSILSSVPVDMNNDGVKSYDVLKEVTTPYVINKTSNFGPYYIGTHATATVTYNKEKNEGSVLIPYPFQSVIYENESSAFLNFYVMQFIGLSYKLNLNDEIEITSISTEHQFADYGIAKSAKKIDKGSLLVVVSAKLYDFKEKKWMDADVEVRCQKH